MEEGDRKIGEVSKRRETSNLVAAKKRKERKDGKKKNAEVRKESEEQEPVGAPEHHCERVGRTGG